ncbi:hypothetical protein [Bacillus sp. V2I10]|uniref:hypothetical protein n=1 Tax=Bacillus sp. V2I10 TaxID=3042276 RepID=UPI002787E373|nr:hypothetical protein [Bacillus sp. V2I10]MDQ0861608.1 hypothetical protein [Bacillus sp. V2I10]
MAKRHLTFDEQIAEQQQEVWELAGICDIDQLNLRNRIFEKGLVMEESECLMTLYKKDSVDVKKDYFLVLAEMKKFYRKISKSSCRK